MSNENRNLCAALAYVERLGWPVFPCIPRSKEPLTPNGFQDATKNPEQIRQWWTRWPNANIGIPTGQVSGFDVLDVDEDEEESGEDTLAALVAKHGELPDTVEQITGRGGRHILFRHREGVRNSAKRLPGLDVRGDGGYIMVAWSIHPNGRKYEWEVSSRPQEVELAEWPDWLLGALQSTNGRPHNPAPAVEGTIPKGRRNETLTSLAGSMRRRGMTPESILAALLVENQRCVPPLPDAEVEHIAGSVCRYNPTSLTANLPSSNRGSEVAGMPGELFAAPLGGQQHQTTQYARQTLADLRASYRPTEWQVDRLLPRPGMLLMAGIPGIGKTWLVLDMALAVAVGRVWLNRFQTHQGAVLLVLEEEDASAILERLDALYGGLGLSQEDGDGLPVHLLVQQGVSLLQPDGTLDAELLRHIQEVQPALIVLDPFRRVHGLEENDSGQMSLLFNRLRWLTNEYGCSLLLVHHLRKRSDGPEDALDRLRGSSDIPASVDSVLEVGGEFGNLTLKHSKSKRGPCLGIFLVQNHTEKGGIRLKFLDPDVKADLDRQAIRQFIVETLQAGEMNMSQLYEASRKQQRGYGKDRLGKASTELVQEGILELRDGPGKSKIISIAELSFDAPAPPSNDNSKREDHELF